MYSINLKFSIYYKNKQGWRWKLNFFVFWFYLFEIYIFRCCCGNWIQFGLLISDCFSFVKCWFVFHPTSTYIYIIHYTFPMEIALIEQYSLSIWLSNVFGSLLYGIAMHNDLLKLVIFNWNLSLTIIWFGGSFPIRILFQGGIACRNCSGISLSCLFVFYMPWA